MALLTSIAVTDELDLLGTALQVTESCIAVELEDGSLHTFDIQGQPLRTFTVDDSDAFGQRSKTFALVGNDLLVAQKSTEHHLEVVNTTTGKINPSIKLSKQPKKIIPYHDEHRNYAIASANLSHVQLIDLSFVSESTTPRILETVADIPPYKIFKYDCAGSTLALLCVRGIVQIWHVSSLNDRVEKLVDLCTICSMEALPPLTSEAQIDVAAEIFSVLVHSTNRVLTGHRDGKIKVWDIERVSDELASRTRGNHRKVLTQPAYIVSNSEPNFLINGLLKHYQAGKSASDVVSTDTGGFIKLWRFADPNSNNKFQLNLVGQHKLFDHSSTCRAITSKGWLIAGGKEGGGQEDVCGLDGQLKALKLADLNNGMSIEVRALGGPSLAVWDLKIVDVEGSQRIVVSLMRRGKAWLEVWNTSQLL